MAAEIIFIRQGLSEANAKNRFEGKNGNSNLHPLGKIQSEFTAEYLKNESIDAIYSSPSPRALYLANCISKVKRMNVLIREDLCEFDGGAWDGKTQGRISQIWPDEDQIWKNNIDQFVAPEGESMKSFNERVKTAIDKIVAENDGKRILVVTHGYFIKNILINAYGYDLIDLKIKTKKCVNTSISEIKYDTDLKKIDVIRESENSHLPPELKITYPVDFEKIESALKKFGLEGEIPQKEKLNIRVNTNPLNAKAFEPTI